MTNLVDDLVEKHCPADRGGWVPAVQAQLIAAELRKTPEGRKALAEWLDTHAESILTNHITQRKPRHIKRRGERMEAALAFWQQHSCPGNVVKTAAEMGKADHLYVSGRHEMLAKTNGMLEAFHRAVAGRLNDRQTTSDVFNEVTYQQLYSSITSTAA